MTGDVERQRNRLRKKSREGDEACGDGCVVGGGRFKPKLTYQAVNTSCGEANNTCVTASCSSSYLVPVFTISG